MLVDGCGWKVVVLKLHGYMGMGTWVLPINLDFEEEKTLVQLACFDVIANDAGGCDVTELFT